VNCKTKFFPKGLLLMNSHKQMLI